MKFLDGIKLAASALLAWGDSGDERSRVRCDLDGDLTLLDAQGTSFRQINLGPATASHPAIRRGSIGVQFVRADGVSGFVWIQCKQIYVTEGIGEFGASPPSSQPAAIADVPTGGSANASDNAAAINAILAVLRARGTIAT